MSDNKSINEFDRKQEKREDKRNIWACFQAKVRTVVSFIKEIVRTRAIVIKYITSTNDFDYSQEWGQVMVNC